MVETWPNVLISTSSGIVDAVPMLPAGVMAGMVHGKGVVGFGGGDMVKED